MMGKNIDSLFTPVSRLMTGALNLCVFSFMCLVLNSVVFGWMFMEVPLVTVPSFWIELRYVTIFESHLFRLSIWGPFGSVSLQEYENTQNGDLRTDVRVVTYSLFLSDFEHCLRPPFIDKTLFCVVRREELFQMGLLFDEMVLDLVFF